MRNPGFAMMALIVSGCGTHPATLASKAGVFSSGPSQLGPLKIQAQSTSSWQNFPIPTMSAPFVLEFDALPSANNISALTSLSFGSASSSNPGAVVLRFNPSGMIDAINGGGYAAAEPISYTSGVVYHFEVEVNLPAHAYTAIVTPDGGLSRVLARDYAFSSTQAGDSSLDDLGIQAAAGNHQISQVILRIPVNAGSAPASAPQPTPAPAIRVYTGSSDYTDSSGHLWSADKDFSGGNQYAVSSSISGTSDPALYQRERYGNFSYVFPVANGAYEVTLKFAEIFWSASGKRIFNVVLNGQTVLSNFDIVAQAGGNDVALDKRFTTNVISGQIQLDFQTVVDNAKVDAIQIVPSSTPIGSPSPAPTPIPAPTAPLAVSPSGTTVPPAAQIVDSGRNIWTLANGQIAVNGTIDPVTNSVILLLYYNGIVYQETSKSDSTGQNLWWYWNGTSWVGPSGVSDPRAVQAPAPTSTPTPTPTPSSGAIPATLFGLHWGFGDPVPPSVNYGSRRLWDRGCQWININTAPGVYAWPCLDNDVNTELSRGKTVLYTFGHTPLWASSTGADSGAPNDLNADGTGTDQHFRDFVTALVTRYKGRIEAYEMWNEPMYSGFWTGTVAQLARMTKDASTLIKSIDPAAKVVSIALSADPASDQNYLSSYLSAGAGPYLDIVSFHSYNNIPESLPGFPSAIRAAMSAHGVSVPIWESEGAWDTGSVSADPNLRAGIVARSYLMNWPNVERFYWYAWDNQGWGTLWSTSTGILPAGVAYGEVYKWMVGATMSSPCAQSGSVWTCALARAGYQALAVWNTSGTSAYSVPSEYHQYHDLTGAVFTPTSSSVTIGPSPILLESGSAF